MACKYFINENGIKKALTKKDVSKLANSYIKDLIKQKTDELSKIPKEFSFIDNIINSGKLTPTKSQFVKNEVQKYFRLLKDGILVPDKPMVYEAIVNPEEFLNKYQDSGGQNVLDFINSVKSDNISISEIITQLVDNKIGFNIGEVEFIDNDVIMGNIYQNQFMMKDGEQPHEMTIDKFEQRLNERSLPIGSSKFDYYLRNIHGNHLYVLVRGSDNFNSTISDLDKLDIPKYKDEEGNIFRISDDGDILYKINGLEFYKKIDPVTGKPSEYLILENTNDINKLQQIASSKKNYNDLVINYSSKTNGNHDVVISGLNYLLNNGTNNQRQLASNRLMLIDMINNKQAISNSAYLKSKYTIEDIETKIKNLNQAYNESVNEGQKSVLQIKINDYTNFLTNYDNDVYLDQIAENILNHDIAEFSKEAKSYLSNNQIKRTDALSILMNVSMESDLKTVLRKNKKIAKDMKTSFDTSLSFLTARINAWRFSLN